MKKITTSICILLVALVLNAQSTKQVLHRVTTEYNSGKSKTEYVYDEFGNEEKREYSTWNNDLNRWESNSKTDRTYDALGNLTSYQSAYWDDITLQWKSDYRYEYFCRFGDHISDSKRYNWDEGNNEWLYYRHWYRTYNPDGQILENIYEYQVEGPISWKDEYTYDENKNLLQEERLHWDDYEQKWEPQYRYTHLYNVDNQREITQFYDLNYDDLWELVRKYEYTYTPNGEQASRIEYDRETGQWLPDTRILNEYDAQGNMTLDLRQGWQADFEDWANLQAVEYTYDAVGNQLSTIETRWNYNTLLFQGSWKDEYQYDQNNNITQYTYAQAAIPGQFIPSTRYTYTYDYDYTQEDLVQPYNITFNNKITRILRESWNVDNNEWQFANQSNYEYTSEEIRTLPVLDVNYVCSNVHPNPATDFINFRVVGASTAVRVRLFDTNGKWLGEQLLNDNHTISVSHLQRGVYFYQLLYNGIQRSGKFMVK